MGKKAKTQPDSILRRDIEWGSVLWVGAGVLTVLLAAFLIWFFALRKTPSPTILGVWVFQPVTGGSMEGLQFRDATYFSRWSSAGQMYNLEGAYSQNGMEIEFSIDKATWPDGSPMQGRATILKLEGSTMEIKTATGKFQLEHRPW